VRGDRLALSETMLLPSTMRVDRLELGGQIRAGRRVSFDLKVGYARNLSARIEGEADVVEQLRFV
jgi:hypothetical protein